MLGFDDSLKAFKKEFQEAGVDMSKMRGWQKLYDKVKRQAPVWENGYLVARRELEEVQRLLKDAEQTLIDKGVTGLQMNAFAKGMKTYQGHFDLELFVSKADSDFQLTYESILKLVTKELTVNNQVLILQSEIENLLALIQEALDKKMPNYDALAFFYMQGSDEQLRDLPHEEKLDKIARVYEREYLTVFRTLVTGKLTDERVQVIMEEELCLN